MKLPPLSLLAVVALAWCVSWAARSHVESRQAQTLARLVRPGDLQMLSSQTCGWCVVARRWMTAQRVPFSECFVERDAACRSRYEALGQPGTPVLLVRGEPVLGFDPERIAAILGRDAAER